MRPTAMTLCRGIATAAAMLALGAQYAAAQVPVEFQGEWVPAKATCQSPVRFRVSADRMTLVNGKDSASYGDIAMVSSYFGPDYEGICVVSLPELNSGNPPFTVFFNADEKKGVTKVDIYQEIKGPGNAQLKAIQAAAKKLAQRFPLNNVPLKKCPWPVSRFLPHRGEARHAAHETFARAPCEPVTLTAV